MKIYSDIADRRLLPNAKATFPESFNLKNLEIQPFYTSLKTNGDIVKKLLTYSEVHKQWIN